MLLSFICRYWPFPNGSGRIIDRFGKNIDLGSGKITARTSDGFQMQVYADDLIGRHIILSGKFDRSIVQVLIDHSRPGDVLMDIGANAGYVSSVFLARVPSSSAICIEPQPGVVDLLKANLEQFGSRARLHEIGLADRNGSLRFRLDPRNRGASRISQDGDVEIAVSDAGSFLADVERLDLIKIDVEGFEEPILRAAQEEIFRLSPRAILFEDQTGSAAPNGALGDILVKLGYQIFGIEKTLLKTRLRPIRARSDCRYNDYIALRQSIA